MDDKYNITLLGVADGTFYVIHSIALSCIMISITGVITVILGSFRGRKQSFHSWNRSDKFIVYLVLCDLFFNIAHMCDHMIIVIFKDHVRPLGLCTFFAVLLTEFVYAQSLLVLFISGNAFLLVRYQKNLYLGRYDWRLLASLMSISFVPVVIALGTDSIGPTGAFCGIQNRIINLMITILPMAAILPLNCALYIATWYHIWKSAKRIRDVIGENAQSVRGCHDSAKIMTSYVLAFVTQWWALAMFGLTEFFGQSNFVCYMFVVTFSNLGGLFNGIVFFLTRKIRQTNRQIKDKTGESVHHTEDTGME